MEASGSDGTDRFAERILVALGSTARPAFSSNRAGKTSVIPLNIRMILHTVLDEYVLPWDGDHGIAHWARVLENGLRLAEETGADIEVVQLFAILHDSQRINEGGDPKHGPRAAAYALKLRGQVFDLPSLILLSGSCTEPVPDILTSGHIPTSRSKPAGTPTGSGPGPGRHHPTPRAASAPRRRDNRRRSSGLTAERLWASSPRL